jgi:WD40 repeat protein
MHDARLEILVLSQRMRIATGHADAVVSIKFSSDGARLASASADRTAKVWDPFTGACLLTLEGHTKARAAAPTITLACAWQHLEPVPEPGHA